MTGIYPFNPAAPDKTKLKAGEIVQQQTSNETVVLAKTMVSVTPAFAVLLDSEENIGAVGNKQKVFDFVLKSGEGPG